LARHKCLRAHDEDVDRLSVHEHVHVHEDESRMIEDVDEDADVRRARELDQCGPELWNELH
jgi:hypothetical protein